MTAFQKLKQQLKSKKETWLITGVAGFIGSNLLEVLLKLNQRVIGLDNFSTGYQHNLDEVQALVNPEQWAQFCFIKGDIRDINDCRKSMNWCGVSLPGGKSTKTIQKIPVDYVLHQAALGSVPRSIEDPITTNQNNIDGFLNMLVATRDINVKRFIYASSSSTYGDHLDLPKVEEKIGNPLSPYAVTKLVNELYSDVFARSYGLKTIGLRYFNIFGRRQDPEGAYAAVIPTWAKSIIHGETVYINGDGDTSRDFCYIDNAVQANLLAATTMNEAALSQVYNVAVGDRTSLTDLYNIIKRALADHCDTNRTKLEYRDFRQGDIRHSLAEISKAKALLGYVPSHRVYTGIAEAMTWYFDKFSK